MSSPRSVGTQFNDAQKLYLKARKQHRRAERDTLMFDCLEFGLIWGELDNYDENQLSMLEYVLARCDQIGPLEIHMACGLEAKPSNRRIRGEALGKKHIALFQEKLNIRFSQALRTGVQRAATTLTILELNGIELCPSSCKRIGRALPESQCLRFLSLRGTKIGDSGLKEMSSGLAANSSIHDLVLNGCKLTDASSSVICSVLRTQGLRRSDERWSRSLRRSGQLYAFQEVFTAEEINDVAITGLLVLDLSDNSLGDHTLKALAHVLAADEWLGALNLARNQVSFSGVNALVQTLSQSNETLVVADLRESAVDCESTQQAIASLDNLLRDRSLSPERGLLARLLPSISNDENYATSEADASTDDESAAVPLASCIIAAAIQRWGSLHQFQDEMKLLETLISRIGPFLNVEMEPTQEQSLNMCRTRSFDSDSLTGRSQDNSASRYLRKELLTSYSIPSTENNNLRTQQIKQKQKPKQKGSVQNCRESEKKETVKMNFRNKVQRPRMESKSKREEKAVAVALEKAFRQQVNRAVKTYAKQMMTENPDVAKQLLERFSDAKVHKASPLDHLEESVQQLNAVLDRIANSIETGTVPEQVPERTKSGIDEVSTQLLDRIAEKVKERLETRDLSTVAQEESSTLLLLQDKE